MIKQLFATLVLACGVITAWADNYAYLTFETTEGNKYSVEIPPVDISISNDTLTVGAQNFVLSNLNSMYFTTVNETSVTGISQIATNKGTVGAIIAAYDLQGRAVNPAEMKAGQVYIVKTNHKNYKIAVQ